MAWRKKVEVPIDYEAEKRAVIQAPEVREQRTRYEGDREEKDKRLRFLVVEYPQTPASLKIKDTKTGEEFDLVEAIAELLNRTEN